MSDVPIDNPAGRLHALLTGIIARGPDEVLAAAYRFVLSAGDVSVAELFRRVADMWGLADQARMQILSLEIEDSDLFLRWCEPIALTSRHALHFNNVVRAISTSVGSDSLLALEWCAARLHKSLPEVDFDRDGIPELIELARQAIDAIAADSDMPHSLRQQLVSRLADVEAALVRFRIVGYAGLAESMDAFTGAVVRDVAAQTGKTVKWVSKLWQLILALSKGSAQIAGDYETIHRAIEGISAAP